MENDPKRLMTIREMRRTNSVPLEADDFVRPLDPCGNPKLYLPYPYIPRHLVDPEKFNELEKLLDTCMDVVSPWGDFASKKTNNRYIQASERFKQLTGVDVWDIFTEARGKREQYLGPELELKA